MQNKAEKAYQEALRKISSGKMIPMLRVIRLKCLDCMCWQENEVRLCPSDDCILWNFRMGRKPIKRVITKERREALKKQLLKSRVAKSNPIK